jgi:hypothetical protein
MYIISSMEVFVFLLVIRHSFYLRWPGFSSHHFVKGVYWPTKCLVPLCMYVCMYSKSSQFKFENPIPTHFTVFRVPWAPQKSDKQKWLHIVLSSAFSKRVAWYLMRITRVSFHPCRQLLWNVHPSNERSWNDWVKESLSWYLTTTKGVHVCQVILLDFEWIHYLVVMK